MRLAPKRAIATASLAAPHAPEGTSPCPARDSSSAQSRRTLLRCTAALGALGLTGTLGACGGGGAPAEAAAAQGAEPAAAAATGESLGPATQVPVGGGKVFREQKVVVTQPQKGVYKAFTAVCTHTGCIVAEVAEGTINCICHGSRYSITDGSVVNPPAPAPLAAQPVTLVGANLSI